MFRIRHLLKQEWFIVFEHDIKRRWYHRFLKTGYHHCYIMTKSDAGLFWLVVNPYWSHVDLDYRAVETFPDILDYTGPYATVIAWQSAIDIRQANVQLSIISCVDIIKRFLGIRTIFLYTPWQLYKWLVKNNGQHIQHGQKSGKAGKKAAGSLDR